MGITFQQPQLSKNKRNANVRFRVTLNVSFAEKEIVKKLGARWDSELKTWYVIIGPTQSITTFTKWLASPIIA